MLCELLDLVERGDLREEHQHVDRVGERCHLLGDLRRRPMVDQVARLRPELSVVAQDVVGALVQRCLRIVADRDVREPGDGDVVLRLLRERLAIRGAASFIAALPAVPKTNPSATRAARATAPGVIAPTQIGGAGSWNGRLVRPRRDLDPTQSSSYKRRARCHLSTTGTSTVAPESSRSLTLASSRLGIVARVPSPTQVAPGKGTG